VRVERPATVRVYLYYFPGWQVLVDGAPALYRISEEQGLIDIDVPTGEHRIDVRMGTTPIRQIGMAISAVTLLPILLLLLWPSGRPKATPPHDQAAITTAPSSMASGTTAAPGKSADIDNPNAA
jgi:hypothetical protein